MTRVLEFIPERCTGCRLCELACSFRHDKEFSISRARIRLGYDQDYCFGVATYCTQCADAPCVEICPVEALTRHPQTQAVVVGEDRCIGCRICSLACPFGAIMFHGDHKAAYKCELCAGDPECVKACYPDALRYVDVREVGTAARQRVVDRLTTAGLSGEGGHR